MRPKVLIINELNINKNTAKPKDSASKPRTTLILYRWH